MRLRVLLQTLQYAFQDRHMGPTKTFFYKNISSEKNIQIRSVMKPSIKISQMKNEQHMLSEKHTQKNVTSRQ